MLKDQVIIGGKYAATVSGKRAVIEIKSVSQYGGWNAVNTATGREVRVRTVRRLKHPAAKWVMSLQPKSPEELDKKPFVCIRCAHPMSAEKTGFITSYGFPVHVACGKVGELQEYKDANGGSGWKLNAHYFAAWYADDQVTPASDARFAALEQEN